MHLFMLLFETSRPMIQNTLFQPENYFKTGTNHDLRELLRDQTDLIAEFSS